ncbi:MAG: hypothetical protein ACRD6W_15005 [Nitrososphaerales archaeon]
MALRIWHQSMTDLSQLAENSATLAEYARVVCAADTVVDLHGSRRAPIPTA